MTGSNFDNYVFVLKLFPIILMAAFILWIVLRDRYHRHTQLITPLEIEKINQLAANGSITLAEADALRQNCHALPQIKEISPVPDLPLRLAAALTYIYAGLLILSEVLLLLFYGAALLLKDAIPGNFTFNILEYDSALLQISSIFFLLLLESIQIIAMRRVLHYGSLKARNTVVIIWILFTALLQIKYFQFGMEIWSITSVTAMCFVLYVLLFRPRSNTKICVAAHDYGIMYKSVLAVLICGFVGINIFFRPVQFSVTYHDETTSAYSSANTWLSGPVSARLQKLYLMPNSPEQLTADVLNQMKQQITGRIKNLQIEVLPFGQMPINFDFNRERCLLLTQCRSTEQQSVQSILNAQTHLPVKIQTAIADELSSMSETAESLTKMKNPLFFQARLLAPQHGNQNFFDGLVFPNISGHYSCDLAIDASQPEHQAVKISAEICKSLLPVLQENTSEFTAVIPEISYSQSSLPEISIPELADFQCIFSSDSFNYNRVAFYRFKRTDYQRDLLLITAALAKLGIQSDNTLYTGNIISFQKVGDYFTSAFLDLGIASPDTNKHIFINSLILNSDYGILEILDYGKNYKDQLNTAQITEFYQQSPQSFILCRGLHLLPLSQRIPIAKEFFTNAKIPLNLRVNLLSSFENEPLNDAEKAIQATAFKDISAALVQEICPAPTPQNLAELKNILYLLRRKAADTALPIRQLVLDLLPHNFIVVDFTPSPTTEGKLTAIKELPLSVLQKSGVIIEFTVPGFLPKHLTLGITETANGQYDVYNDGFLITNLAYADLTQGLDSEISYDSTSLWDSQTPPDLNIVTSYYGPSKVRLNTPNEQCTLTTVFNKENQTLTIKIDAWPLKTN